MGVTSNTTCSPQGGTALLNIVIGQEELAELEKEARRKKRSVAQIIQFLIDEHLEELADYRAIQAAIKADKGKPPVPASEVFRRNGLES